MSAVPIKAEYGPTLGQLLAPRWHAASRLARVIAILAAVALVVLAAGAALTLENATYSHGGRDAFSFSYRGLYRVAPDPGGYAKVQSRGADGALKYSYAVDPLVLPPYTGGLSGALPIYATGYIERLARRSHAFVLRGEGKTRVNNNIIGYQILYTTDVEGRPMYGRNVLLLPERTGAREGVNITMLTATTASPQVGSPMEVASTGVLLRPLKTFAFG
jgi:hypothetical protein